MVVTPCLLALERCSFLDVLVVYPSTCRPSRLSLHTSVPKCILAAQTQSTHGGPGNGLHPHKTIASLTTLDTSLPVVAMPADSCID